MCIHVPRTAWFQHLHEILAGLQFLPAKLDALPYLLVYKQSPSWDLYGLPDRVNIGDLLEVEQVEQAEQLLSAQCQW